MYVRWKRRAREHTRRYPWSAPTPPTITLSAYLVESRRVNGKPRQQIVAYLGTIEEGRTRDIWPRLHFWQNVNRRLDALPDDLDERMTEAQATRGAAALRAVVPEPTQAELEQAQAEVAASRRKVAELLAHRHGRSADKSPKR